MSKPRSLKEGPGLTVLSDAVGLHHIRDEGGEDAAHPEEGSAHSDREEDERTGDCARDHQSDSDESGESGEGENNHFGLLVESGFGAVPLGDDSTVAHALGETQVLSWFDVRVAVYTVDYNLAPSPDFSGTMAECLLYAAGFFLSQATMSTK